MEDVTHPLLEELRELQEMANDSTIHPFQKIAIRCEITKILEICN